MLYLGDELLVKINQKSMNKFRLLITPIFILILFACATAPIKKYEETVSQWKSYEDVEKWMKVILSMILKDTIVF
jgi:hypothetical protein